MRVALAMTSGGSGFEADEEPLLQALRARGADARWAGWSDPEDWSSFDAVLIRTTWDYQGRFPEFMDWAARVPRLHHPLPILRWNLVKTYLRELEAEGVPCIPTLWVPAGESVTIEWEAGFLKPVVGAGAIGTQRFSGASPVVGYDAMIQPYLKRVETGGERSWILIDGQITHGVVKRPPPGDYRVQEEWGATDHPLHTPSAADADVARRAFAAAEKILGQRLLYGRADLLDDDAGQPRLVELELVEPALFFRHGAHAADRLAEALLVRASS